MVRVSVSERPFLSVSSMLLAMLPTSPTAIVQLLLTRPDPDLMKCLSGIRQQTCLTRVFPVLCGPHGSP